MVQEAVLEPVIQVPIPKSEDKANLWNINLQHPARLILIALLLGWMFDYLFWKQLVGVNFVLFLTFSVIGGLYFLLSEGLKPSRNSLWLLLPFSFFVVITFMRREPLTIFLAFMFSLFSLGLLATSYQGGRWQLYHLSDYFYKFLLLIGDAIGRSFGFLRQLSHTSSPSDQKKPFVPVSGLLRGVLIALPIVLCFGSLLASGDVVFQQKIDDFFDAETIEEYIQRSLLILLFAYLLAGIYLHAATRSADEKVTQDKQSFIKPFLGFTESAVVLGSVSSLFLIFVSVQFRYFFGGETNIGVEGYTYSQYARRGFNELVTVAFFSLLMLVVLSTLTRRQEERQRQAFSILNIIVVLLVMVILFSAYQRISLAIGWHGYSRLRLYPRIFLIWLGLLLIAVAFLEISRQERYFMFATVLAALGFAATLTLLNVDAAIVKRNVYRSWHGRNLNVPHLASLSTDAVPALAEEFLSPSLPTSTHEGVGAILACYRYFESGPHISPYDWRSFNYSSWKAEQALDTIRPGLAGYVIRYNKYPVRVRTPSGVVYPCRAYDAANDRE